MTESIRIMRGLGVALVCVFLLAVGALPGVAAEKTVSGTISVKYDNASLLFAFHAGSGTMTLNDGSEYEVSLDGYSIGSIGYSTSTAIGKVYNLRQPSDLNGEYSGTGTSFAFVESGPVTLKNRSNDVVLELKSEKSGLRLSVSAGFVTFRLGKLLRAPRTVKSAPPPVVVMKAPPPVANKPVEYELEFGFNKSRVSLAIGRYLDTVVADWKGKPVRFRVVGHTDLVGSKDFNQKLSQARADAVKKALVDRGIPASKITATGVGKADPAVPTPAGKRKRANRRAVILIEEAN